MIRQAEQALNGFMAYIRRQKAGAQEFGDQVPREERLLPLEERDE